MSNVKLLLKEKVKNLGDIGDVVSVKPGYARNFLLPNKLAALPTPGEMKSIKKKKELLEQKYKEEKEIAEIIAKKITDYGELVIYSASGDAGKLFGRVTAKDITEKINTEVNLNIERKQLQLRHSIAEVGEYEVNIKLHSEITATVKVVVKKQE